MMRDLEEKLEEQKQEFEEAATLCAQAIHGMNQRVERIEKWMEIVTQLNKKKAHI